MLKWLWEYHRTKIYAFAGAALFLLSGAALSLYPFGHEGDEPLIHRQAETAVPPRTATKGKTELLTSARVPVAIPGAPRSAVPQNANENGEVMTVHIVGHVKRPGIYRLPLNSRMETLVRAAGGFDGFADENAVNMAEILKDGVFIEIPYKWKTPERKTSVSGASSPRSAKKPKTSSKKWDERVDINHADEKTLTQLRGIGPTLARRIVEYRREHGPFRSVEDLINVKGIGGAKVYGMRDQAFVTP